MALENELFYHSLNPRDRLNAGDPCDSANTPGICTPTARTLSFVANRRVSMIKAPLKENQHGFQFLS